MLITLPAYTALRHRGNVGALDVAAAAVFLGCLVGETVADQQQWTFQTWKRHEIAAGRDPDSRFVQTGLFGYSRHPSFFFEQAQWWVFFAFGAIAVVSEGQLGRGDHTGLIRTSSEFARLTYDCVIHMLST